MKNNLLTKSNLPTISGNNTLNPFFVTGLTDAEGCFTASIYKALKLKMGWRVITSFKIALHQRDLALLKQLQVFFGGIGTITFDKATNSYSFRVTSLSDLKNIIIPHFKNYPLISQKAADFLLFEQIVELMLAGEHLTKDGLNKIVAIKASMNLGLSDVLKAEFSHIVPVNRPIIETTEIADPNWISGFTSGEGNFDAMIRKYPNKIGFRVSVRFRIGQHIRDHNLMLLIKNWFGVGIVEIPSNKASCNVVVTKISDISHKIIPFFNQYPIIGIKSLDFIDWSKIANLMDKGSHLTVEGLNEIRKIRAGMNSSRK